MACALSRMDAELAEGKRGVDAAGVLLVGESGRRIDESLRGLERNDDHLLFEASRWVTFRAR
jgi:hypothetical protein